MMRFPVIAALCLSMQAVPALATGQAAPEPSAERDHVGPFLTALKAGAARKGVENIMASTPLWQNHPGFSEQMIGQIDAAVRAYGPVSSWEKVSTENLGTMVRRERYLVAHRDAMGVHTCKNR